MDKYTASAGAISSATAAMTTDLELGKIVLIGALGAVAYAMKSIKVDDAKAKPISTALTIPWLLLTPFVLTVIIYYIGTDGFNLYIKDIGEMVWLWIGLAAGLFNDKIFPFFGNTMVIGRDKKLKDES